MRIKENQINSIQIGDRKIGSANSTYMIAELSANHGGSLDQALKVIRAMKDVFTDNK
jgi:sialic acid synthase SpsE